MKTQLSSRTPTDRLRELGSNLIWPVILLISIIAAIAALRSAGLADARPGLEFWFLLFVPGMAFVRLLHVREWMAEWALAVALSIALDTLVTLAMIYLHGWNPALGFAVILTISLVGILAQFAQALGRVFG